MNFILLFSAFICLSLAALDVKSQRVNLGWLGLALWILSQIVSKR